MRIALAGVTIVSDGDEQVHFQSHIPPMKSCLFNCTTCPDNQLTRVCSIRVADNRAEVYCEISHCFPLPALDIYLSFRYLLHRAYIYNDNDSS